MDLSFGARLRLQRERQQVPLTAIAEQTKIKMSLLDGLERDDLTHWPGGIFRRSYVRAYAHAIGLEPEAVVGEFLARYPDPVEDVPGALPAGVNEVHASSKRPPTRLSYLISSAMSALPTRRPPSVQKDRTADLSPAVEPQDIELPGAAESRHDPDRLEPRTPGDLLAAAQAFDETYGAEATVIREQADAHDEPAVREVPLVEVRAVAAEPPVPVDLPALATLCTRLACAVHVREVTPALADAARLLDAVGIVLWTWDARGGLLRHALSYGYSEQVVAQLPRVRPDADNAIAWAFRSAETRVVDGGAGTTGAVAAPLMTPSGCAGVFAVELREGGERRDGVRPAAAILAAQLSALLEAPALAHAVTA